MNSAFWTGKKIVVTGGSGFIGSHLVEQLLTIKANVTVVDKESSKFIDNISPKINFYPINLLKPRNKLHQVFKNQDIIFHLAARVAGIDFNSKYPATMLADNLKMTLVVFDAAKKAQVKHIQFVSSACVYPRFCTIPTPETEGFKDEPEPTNYGYGWAKRIGEIIAKTYSQEHNLNISIVRPYNAYGPRDNFNPVTSHVIPALIKRIMDGQNPVIVWGDGSPTRSFLYVKDLAKGFLAAVEKHSDPQPINLGTSEETSIKDLVTLIIKLSGSQAKIQFDTAKPNGQPRRNCDTTKARKKIGFHAPTPLEKGLKETISWYKQNFRYKLK